MSVAAFTAARIKAIRGRLGLTQAEFGYRLHISQKSVSPWEIHGLPRRHAVVLRLLELE
jgi:DNA-binding transcriptional regulator YiaG